MGAVQPHRSDQGRTTDLAGAIKRGEATSVRVMERRRLARYSQLGSLKGSPSIPPKLAKQGSKTMFTFPDCLS